MKSFKDGRGFSAVHIAYIALATALLIAAQYALSFVAGVEIVTVLLLCFSAYFGVACGVATAVSFSLLRCLLWGFSPNVIVLYLIYFPLFALCFGLLGKIKDEKFDRANPLLASAVNGILLLIAAACTVCAAAGLIKISKVYALTVRILLYAVAGIFVAVAVAFDVLFILVRRKKIKSGKPLKLFLFASVAALCTVCFTLLDDLIAPLFYGMTRLTALSYFYASFLAMLPQVICTVVTVSALYFPLTLALTKACARAANPNRHI